MDALIRKGLQDFEAVTDVDCVKMYGDHSFLRDMDRVQSEKYSSGS